MPREFGWQMKKIHRGRRTVLIGQCVLSAYPISGVKEISIVPVLLESELTQSPRLLGGR